MGNVVKAATGKTYNNRKTEYRNVIASGSNDVVFFLLDPNFETKIQVDKNGQPASVDASSDTVLLTGTPINDINLTNSTILFTNTDTSSTTDYYAIDTGVSILKLTGDATLGAINYNVTQDRK